jgi:hypothetical protein
MIIRISGEGQYRLDDAAQARINELDAELEAALAGDGFPAALAALLAEVRALGQPLADDELAPSDVVLPPSDATVEEVRGMLTGDGLIPG